MATEVKVDLPNLVEGAEVEVDGLGHFENGADPVEVDEATVSVYTQQRGHPPYSGAGVLVYVDGELSRDPATVDEDEELVDLNKLKKPELQEQARLRGLDDSGKVADLIERIVTYDEQLAGGPLTLDDEGGEAQ